MGISKIFERFLLLLCVLGFINKVSTQGLFTNYYTIIATVLKEVACLRSQF